MSTLTERQSRFVELFLHGPDGVRLVATQAARAAGYAWPAKQGPRLLTFPHVVAAIDAGLERLAVHVGKSREKEEACTRRAGEDDGFTASHCGLSGTGS